MNETSGSTVDRVKCLVWLRVWDRVAVRIGVHAKSSVWWLAGDRVDARVQRSVGGRESLESLPSRFLGPGVPQ